MHEANVTTDLIEILAARIVEKLKPEILIEIRQALKKEQPPEKLLFSIREAAKKLDISGPTLQRYIDSGKLKTVKLGARRLIPYDEILRVAEDGFVLKSQLTKTPG